MVSRSPDYRIAALHKLTNAKSSKIGAAWKNEDGTISIRLDAFVTLHGGEDLMLTLFPATGFAAMKHSGAVARKVARDSDDEIPF